MIVEVVPFPAMVKVVEGVMVRVPVLLLPDQKALPKVASVRVKRLLPGPPVALFQVTWTVETVTE